MLGQLPDTPEELLKLDQVSKTKKEEAFIRTRPSGSTILYSFVLELFIYVHLIVDICVIVYTTLNYITSRILFP